MKRSAQLSVAVEATAWIIGGALLMAYAGAEWRFSRANKSGLQEFAVARQQMRNLSGAPATSVTTTEPLHSLRASEPDMTEWSSGRITAYRALDHSASPQAVLHIPSIDLEVPVYVGVTEENLNRGAAWIETTAPLGDSGNAGLASHRDGYFRALRAISVGDRIELQTLVRSHVYTVDEIFIVEPEDVHVLGPSNDRILTLVTCYPFYMVGPAPKRFIVRARAASARDLPLSYASASDPSAT